MGFVLRRNNFIWIGIGSAVNQVCYLHPEHRSQLAQTWHRVLEKEHLLFRISNASTSHCLGLETGTVKNFFFNAFFWEPFMQKKFFSSTCSKKTYRIDGTDLVPE